MKFKIGVICLTLLLSISSLSAQEEKKENPFTAKWDNGFKVESADKQFKLKFGGRIMVDHAFFSQDDDLESVFGELETKNGTEFRRLRFFTSGTIYGNVDFKLQVDFANGEVKLKDAYIGIKNIPVIGNIRAGHLYEPFRLETLTSSKYITFMERSFSDSFSPGRNNGIILFNDFFNKKLSLQAGYFRNSDGSGNDKAANDDYALTARATSLLFNNTETKHLLHIGVGVSRRKTDSNEYSVSSRSEAHLSSKKYISTSTIEDVNNINLANFEAAFVANSFSLQGEYLTANVNTGDVTTIDTYKFSSYYGMASYFLTGETRKYKSSYAGFDRVKPNNNFGSENNGAGAWELALRYSHSDLNSEDILGGEQSDITLGANWYLNPSTRIMLNHVWADVQDAGKANIFQMRFQLDF